MDLENALSLPDACRVGKTVFKKLFTESGDIRGADRALFTDVVDKVSWLFCLKPETVNIPIYADEEREYTEIEFIEVSLLKDAAIRRIAEIVMRSIPYPMVLLFSLDGRYQIWTAHQKTNRNRAEANTLEGFTMTGWLDAETTLKTLDVQAMRSSNYFDLYSDIVDMVSLEALREFAPSTTIKEGQKARDTLKTVMAVEEEIATYRSAIKKEDQFNRKVELNIKIKDLQDRVEKIKTGNGIEYEKETP